MSITIALTSAAQYSSASPAASATTITIAKGAQNSSNKEFYVPPQSAAKPGSTITWKMRTQQYIQPLLVRMQRLTANSTQALFLQGNPVNL